MAGILKLCDFGFARTLAGPGARYTDYVATRWYRGPELLTGDTQYGKPVDIWAIGCMLPEMASGAPLFPGESDIDQLFHIMRCFGQLPPKLMDIFRQNPLFIGIKIPENISSTESLEERFPTYPVDQLKLLKLCLKYEPDDRCTCEELMNHEYFTEDGFVEWFDEELKQMLERDAADFKMRQKKFRRNQNQKGGRGGGGSSNDPDSRPQSQPPASSGGHPPPLNPKLQQSFAQPSTIASQPEPAQYHPTGGEALAEEPLSSQREGGHLPQQLLGGRDIGAYHAGSGGELGPPQHGLDEGRRPATRGSESMGGGSGDFGGPEEMPLLPNLQRPSTPRAQRLVAFPQLASALEDGPSNTSMGGGNHSRNWGGGVGNCGGQAGYSHQCGSSYSHQPSYSHQHQGAGGYAPPVQSSSKGKGRISDEVPSMPSLSANPLAPASCRSDGAGGSNLPQLKEGQLFAAELPDRHAGTLGSGLGGNSLAHAPVPASRGAGAGKKKNSAYDPSNPYFSKPTGKSKSKTSKSTSNSSHGLSSQSGSCGGAGSTSQMGVIGQAHSIAGLAAAYALPPSALPPSIPRTPNHDYEYAPPRTPGESTQYSGQGLENASHLQMGVGGGSSSFAAGSSRHAPLGSSSYQHSNYSQQNYTGGQYAKYGKRY